MRSFPPEGASKLQPAIEQPSTGGFWNHQNKIVKVAQSCLTLWNPMDYTLPGILQAGILEWVAFPSPGDLPNPGIKSRSPTSKDKDTQRPKTKIPHIQRQRRSCNEMIGGAPIKIKSNLIPAGRVTHRLENRNTKEVLALLCMF